MPLGTHRSISVYDRVIVGSDGSPSALYAVERAHEVAAAAESRLIVVTAYDQGRGPEPGQAGGRILVHGEDAARAAMRRTVQDLTSDRIRGDIEQVVVAAQPADALLQAAGNRPASLIVVGNRGLGAQEGEVLGSVPREVVRRANCDVLVIQTSALSEPT